MSLFKLIRRSLPLVAGLLAAVFLCGAGGQSCSAEDIDHVFDPENFDSSEITNIQPIPIPGDQGFYNLRFDLTERGRKLWINLSVQHKGQELAFVIDGTVYRGIKPRLISDEATTVIVDGPFDQATALALQNNAKFNYYKMRK